MFTYKLVEVDIKGSEQSTRQPFGSGFKRSKKVHRLRTFSTSRRLAKKSAILFVSGSTLPISTIRRSNPTHLFMAKPEIVIRHLNEYNRLRISVSDRRSVYETHNQTKMRSIERNEMTFLWYML